VKDSRWLKYFIFPFTRYSTRRTVNYLSESEFRLATAACKMTMYSDGITAESDKAANRYDAIYHSGKIMVTAKWVQTPQQHYQLKMSNRNRTGVSAGYMWPKKFSLLLPLRICSAWHVIYTLIREIASPHRASHSTVAYREFGKYKYRSLSQTYRLLAFHFYLQLLASLPFSLLNA